MISATSVSPIENRSITFNPAIVRPWYHEYRQTQRVRKEDRIIRSVGICIELIESAEMRRNRILRDKPHELRTVVSRPIVFESREITFTADEIVGIRSGRARYVCRSEWFVGVGSRNATRAVGQNDSGAQRVREKERR